VVDRVAAAGPPLYRGVTVPSRIVVADAGETTVDASPLTHRQRGVPPGGGSVAVTEPPAPLPLPPGPYELRVSDLRTRWPDGEVVALGDADLLLPPGRRLALVARSRLGTSALAAVLLRLLDYEGTVTLNDVQLRDLSADDVRTVIGLCAHDARIFDVTVAENVRLARPEATDEEVRAALRRAGIGLPAEAPAGPEGAAFSGGERQRIALARALLADVPILIVEEPDARLSDDDADAVLAELLAAAEGRTLLLVTHRPVLPGAAPILRHADEVVTLGYW
jgi:ABC-type multidrug transport system fused ATPase/permease subunit